jgi:hypothetical protein
MKRTLLFILFLFFVQQFSYAQKNYTVSGIVQDTSGNPLTGTVIKLISQKDSLTTSADINGMFNFSKVNLPEFKISAAFIGFETLQNTFKFDPKNTNIKLPLLKLKVAVNELNEVVITGVIPVVVKEDTVQYDAKAFKVQEGDAVEEMIKKLPGVTVDKDGKVTAQGKPITKIRVNGKDFFGADVATAIQNLPADIIQNLQIIDDYGDQAKLTGIKAGEPEKIINLNIQPDKKRGYFARGEAGMGSDDRYRGFLRGNNFVGEQQISFESSLGNTRGGNGITNSKSAGINYRDELGKKIIVYGNYNFNTSNNNTVASSYSQSFFPNYTRYDDQANNNTSGNSNHNLNGNIEYKIDTLNFLKFSPSIGYNSNESDNSGLTYSTLSRASSIRNNSSTFDAASPNFGANLLYNHIFMKKGRNFSINTNVNFNKREQNRNVRNLYTNTDSLENITETYQYQLTDEDNSNQRIRINASYREPLTQTSFLELNYDWNRSVSDNNRDTRDIDPQTEIQTQNSLLSNHYKYSFTTNRFGLNYRVIKEKFNYTAGIVAQPVSLNGDNITRNIHTQNKTFNWIPNARFVYKFSRTHSLTASYHGNSNQPGFYQLQPLTDNSNLQNTVIGNPNLKPEFTNSFNLNYNQSDIKTGYTLFANLSFNQTQNKIVTSRVIIPDSLKQETRYLNTDGFRNINGNYTYTKPFAERKYTFTYYGSSNFNNNITFVNNERNQGKNFVIEQGVKFRFDLEKIIDAEINTSYSINTTRYTLASYTDRNTSRYYLGLQGRNFFFDVWTLGYDFSKTINSGYNNAVTNPIILGAYIERKLFKGNMGSIRLQGSDLFNQNAGVQRDVFDNQIIDRQSNRLGRYFLISLNYRIRKFAGGLGGNRSDNRGNYNQQR